MKQLILVFVAAAAFALPVYSQPLTPEQKKSAEEVIATISKWADAVRGRDMKALDQIFAEDLFVTLADGRTRRKKEELATIGSGTSRPLSIVNEDLEVRMMGDAAVVTGLTKMRYRVEKIEVPVNLRSTSVFAKREGRWQLVVLQIANLAPASAAAAAPASRQ